MLNLLTSSQIRDADARTISARSISSLELMEAASSAFVAEFEKEVPERNIPISIYCGTGNNGGDGLAVARILKQRGYGDIRVKIARFSRRFSPDFDANLERLKAAEIEIRELTLSPFPDESGIVIDALLGSGLNKPIEGELKDLVDHINALKAKVISIDVPSGFPSEGIIAAGLTSVKAALAISFQRAKINFFFPESASSVSRFAVVPIGLDESYIQSIPGPWKLIEQEDISSILKPRQAFSHKGTYGHALIIAGNKNTMGAALLCADACVYSGAGLTSACIPESGLTALNTRSPEVMAVVRKENIPAGTFEKYSALAVGPGLGVNEEAADLLRKVLASKANRLVLDADALTILSNTPDLFRELPPMTILTPHMKEFDRMFGEHRTWWERVETACKKSAELNVLILLKNRYSFIILPDGSVLINPTGNPAMAVGGMGDVLTGMLASFLAQGYDAREAAILACYLHGKAGDDLKNEEMSCIPPRYLIERLPYVIPNGSAQ